ncbi:hypothetical protein [Gordonia malaquae]|uniref:hypothetical protein n=1 Tax=Gordonia malaquae TaxID=410332 RepID=UPI00301A2B63
MGAGGAALVLILILLLVVTVPLGLILLVVAYNTRGDKHSRATAIIGGVLIGSVPVGTLVLIVAMVTLDASGLLDATPRRDPDTLVVDLRSPDNASELGGTRNLSPNTIREFTSDNIDLTFPDGSSFTAHDVQISIHIDTSDRIEFMSIMRRSEPRAVAVGTLRSWSHDLGITFVPPTPLDREWEQSAESDGAVIGMRLLPTGAGGGISMLTVQL